MLGNDASITLKLEYIPTTEEGDESEETNSIKEILNMLSQKTKLQRMTGTTNEPKQRVRKLAIIS